MQFHDYLNLRSQMAKFGHNEQVRKMARSTTPDEFRHRILQRLMATFKNGPDGGGPADLDRLLTFSGEQSWVDSERPYYNVWPIATELARSVKLELPFSAIEIPFDSLVLRFPRGREPQKVATAMVYWPKGWPSTMGKVNLTCYFPGTMDRMTFRHDYGSEETVENWLERIAVEKETPVWQSMGDTYKNANADIAPLLIRIVAFIGLLANDKDMITPVILAKDQSRYESAKDDDARKWIEERAARRLGRGFEIGKRLQMQREASAHWRNPHLCLFWTGPGRTVPVLRMRSGALVHHLSMASVPTGYLGPEDADEDSSECTFVYFAEAVGQNRIKIGKADDPRVRLRQLQTGSPDELRLLGVIAADAASWERDVQSLFGDARMRGEWFEATPELRQYIENFATKAD